VNCNAARIYTRADAQRDRRDQRQSRAMSLVEAVTNVIVGFALAIFTQLAVFPVLDLSITTPQALLTSAIFTAISLLRAFALRRLFEWFRSNGASAEGRDSNVESCDR
jgi:putative flippase GtrA